MCNCNYVSWTYSKNPYNDTWILEYPGEPFLYVANEHTAKYLVKKLNELKGDKDEKI